MNQASEVAVVVVTLFLFWGLLTFYFLNGLRGWVSMHDLPFVR